MIDMAHAPQHEKPSLKKWQQALAAGAVASITLILIGYGVAGSYESLSHLAAAHGVPLARLAPVGLDGGLLGVIILDIVLTWARSSLVVLRFAARLLAIATVAANAWAGWPDPVAVFYRVFAPLLIVIISEAIRSVLLRRSREDEEPVPFARWVLAPASTFRLWRRMKLWRITDYGSAVDMELLRLQAIARLTDRFGEGWRGKAPGSLAWMLTSGVRMDDALNMVAELTAPEEHEAVPVSSPPKARGASPRKLPRKRGTPQGDVGTMAEAITILAAEPDISGSELGRRLGRTPRYGCMLKAKLTASAGVGG